MQVNPRIRGSASYSTSQTGSREKQTLAIPCRKRAQHQSSGSITLLFQPLQKRHSQSIAVYGEKVFPRLTVDNEKFWASLYCRVRQVCSDTTNVWDDCNMYPH